MFLSENSCLDALQNTSGWSSAEEKQLYGFVGLHFCPSSIHFVLLRAFSRHLSIWTSLRSGWATDSFLPSWDFHSLSTSLAIPIYKKSIMLPYSVSFLWGYYQDGFHWSPPNSSSSNIALLLLRSHWTLCKWRTRAEMGWKPWKLQRPFIMENSDSGRLRCLRGQIVKIEWGVNDGAREIDGVH